jgi:probable rRNA maturation factor
VSKPDISLQVDEGLQEDIPDPGQFEQWAEAALRPGSIPELSIRIVAEDEGRELNLAYREKDYATNVLSFPFEAPAGLPIEYLGDLVICAPVVSREAREQGKSLESHWAHMVVHGVLHLQGYDHIEEAEAEQMETLEKHILAQLGYANPYQDED